MKANDAYFMKFLSQSNVCFEIPVYQRNYDWSEENCKQLLEDISACIENDLKSYFVGSIVHIQNNGPVSVTGVNDVVIIDGQQRITTVSLILLAIATTSKDKNESDSILNSYLLNPMQTSSGKIKLKPIKGDNQVFTEIVNGKEPTSKNTVGKNFKYLRDAFKSGVFDRQKVLNGLGRLKIVEVSLETGVDNPQLIFESLNSTGLDLSPSDLVRNFILMSLSYQKQKELYEKYWIEIEKNCCFNAAEFIKDFLIIKTKKIPPKNSVYKMFKNYALGESKSGSEELLKSLLDYSKIYNYLWDGNHPNKNISRALKNLRRVEAKSITPFIISLLEDFENKKLSDSIVVAAIDLIESYIIRRSICEIPSSSLAKTFASLHREVKRVGEEDWTEKYKDYLMYVLARKSNKGRYPKDSEVRQAIAERDFYQFNNIIRNYIFESIENKNKRERTNIQEGLADGELSIEHIMPQTLSKKWKASLGDEFKEIHEKYLNVLGNLTITGFNSKLSNKSFDEKVKEAFLDSPYWLNEYVAKQNEWNESQIVERSKLLEKRIFELWPDVARDQEYETDQHEEHNLADPIDIKYTVPVSLEINGNSYSVTSYREVMAEFLKYTLAIDTTKLFGLQKVEKFSTCIISDDPSVLRSPFEIADGLFTEGSASATTHVKNIARIAPHFNIDLENIVVVTMKERKTEFKINKSA